MKTSPYDRPRAVVQIIIFIVLIFGAIAAILTLAVGFSQRSPLPGLVAAALVLLNVGLAYALLHGVLAVFDIAENTARSSEVVTKTATAPATAPKASSVDKGYITSSGPQRRS